jgi:glycosyltransferase involved in cell wall biosynthesis
MSAGLPVIASDTGGTSEIVNESNGRLFEFQNVEQLVEETLELISNKPIRENLGENSAKKALCDFSVERMMSNYVGIIEEVIG